MSQESAKPANEIDEDDTALDTGLPENPVSVECFEAAVRAAGEAVNQAKLFLFLSRHNSIRLMAAPGKATNWLDGQTFDEDVEKRKRAWRELSLILNAYGRSFSLRNTEDVLEQYLSTSTGGYLPPERVDARKKIGFVVSVLVGPAMKLRRERLKTQSGTTLEDVDVDLITKRVDSVGDKSVDEPFLRLRIRHADGNTPEYGPFWLIDSTKLGASFEMECDESDIDLLFQRLQYAKDLLRAAKQPNEATST